MFTTSQILTLHTLHTGMAYNVRGEGEELQVGMCSTYQVLLSVQEYGGHNCAVQVYHHFGTPSYAFLLIYCQTLSLEKNHGES